MQWTGCHGEERHGGDRGCGGCNGQGVMVRRDMEVTGDVGDAVIQNCHSQLGVTDRKKMIITYYYSCITDL